MTSSTAKTKVIEKGITVVLNMLCVRPLLFYWLWNWIMVSKFNMPEFSFWEGFWLLFLIGMIIEGIEIHTKEKE